ncbi:UNVERIFIED_CONTAM: hypothetical protein Sindi_3092600 [Sesamum indicum]
MEKMSDSGETETTETEKTSNSGDKLAGSDGEDGCPGGVPSSNLAAVTGKQSEGMIQSAVIFGLEVSPENQSWPESGHISTTNSSPPTCADVDPTRNDVENVVDLEADVGICADVMHEVSNDVMVDVADDVMDDVAADVMDDVAADVTGDVSNNVEKISPTITQVRSFPMGLFVGNIPLNVNSNMGADDKIANAFNNSSRRTLSYIPLTIQNGEVVVRPTMETIRNGSIKWKTTAVGYFLGKRPYFYHVKDFAFSAWPGLRKTVDIPWLIGGNFNAVRDISEICGASGDIRMEMEEFNNCVQNAASKNAVDEGGDQCSQVFFRKIAQRRSARRILQINDDHGTTHTEPQAVVNEFVMYYQNLLGGEQRRDVIDLRFLRPWVRHLLSEEEVHSLLLPFTPVDVKQAIFDIVEDKAPGSDDIHRAFSKMHGL